MYNRKSGLSSYGRIANTESDPLKQIVMLYDGAIKFLSIAAADIEAKDFESKGQNTGRALDIINYLQSILDLEKGGSVGRSLDELYTGVRTLVLRATIAPDAALMRSAAEALRPVRDAWETNASLPHAAVADRRTSSLSDRPASTALA